MRLADRIDWIPPSKGTYALLFECNRARRVRIGSLGVLATETGYYVYCGSAFGPGGLRARVSRHMRLDKKKRWHIDYLRPFLKLYGVWYAVGGRHLEHEWADRLLDVAYRTSAAVVPLKRFGASDCRCATHLVRLPFPPRLADVAKARPKRHGIVSVRW